MDTPEMTEVSVEIELLGDDGVTRCLLQIETGRRDEITGSEEVGKLRSYIPVGLGENIGKVSR